MYYVCKLLYYAEEENHPFEYTQIVNRCNKKRPSQM